MASSAAHGGIFAASNLVIGQAATKPWHYLLIYLMPSATGANACAPAIRRQPQTRRWKMTSKKSKPRASQTAKQPPKGKGTTPAKATKQARLIAMLQRPEGATIEQVAKALQWQKPTVRGAIADALKKKGLKVTSKKEEAGRVYRIAELGQRTTA
jgi:hypothetical protein